MGKFWIAALCLIMAACGEHQRMDTPIEEKAQSKEKSKPAERVGNPDVTRAMEAIPQGQLPIFQKALACEVRRNAAKGNSALEIDAAYIEKLAQRVDKEPELAAC